MNAIQSQGFAVLQAKHEAGTKRRELWRALARGGDASEYREWVAIEAACRAELRRSNRIAARARKGQAVTA